MPKLLLMSVLVVAMALPIVFARSKSAKSGLRRTVLATASFIVIWAVYCAYFYPDLAGDGK